jgi:TRAP-type mannitol/chloroaromatic compound transport system substrate-binding protein
VAAAAGVAAAASVFVAPAAAAAPAAMVFSASLRLTSAFGRLVDTIGFLPAHLLDASGR